MKSQGAKNEGAKIKTPIKTMMVLDLELKSTLLNHELAVDYYERLVFF